MALYFVVKAAWIVRRAAARRLILLGCIAALSGCASLLDIESDPQLVDASPSGQQSKSCEGKLWVKLTTDNDTAASGSARDIAPSYIQGIIDYIAMLNDRPAGIRGCKVDLQVGEGVNSAVVAEQVMTGGWATQPVWDD